MRHRYTRQELESITRETPVYLEGAGIAQLQWGGWEIAEGVRDGYLFCKHIKPFALELYDKYWTAFDGPPEKDYKQATNADRIRAMSDEELSEFISRIEIGDFGQQVYGKTFCDMCKGQYECDDCRLWWLQQPAEEDT